jgi:hypothetical protein
MKANHSTKLIKPIKMRKAVVIFRPNAPAKNASNQSGGSIPGKERRGGDV